jgi:hypothetical protein
LMLSMFAFASCQSAPKPATVERAVTSKGCPRAILEEHQSLMAENIRLKASLKLCRESH